MVLVRCSKLALVGCCLLPMSFGALATGVLFGQLVLAAARNPVEFEKMYGTSLTAFALIETFSFLGLITVGIASAIL